MDTAQICAVVDEEERASNDLWLWGEGWEVGGRRKRRGKDVMIRNTGYCNNIKKNKLVNSSSVSIEKLFGVVRFRC